MFRPIVLLAVAAALLVAPEALLDLAGADQPYETELLRYVGALLVAQAGLLAHVTGKRPVIHRGIVGWAIGAQSLAGLYVVTGDGLFLVLLFTVLVGVSLKLVMPAA